MKMQDKFDFKKINTWLGEYETGQWTAYLEPLYIRNKIQQSTAAANTQWMDVVIHVMTREEYEGKAGVLNIHYSIRESRFGKVIIASTGKGVCYMGFAENETGAMQELKKRFPQAQYTNKTDAYQDDAYSVLDQPTESRKVITLHVKGTAFQIGIWKKLLQVPLGGLVSYASLAGDVKKARAVGTAVGDNPIGFLVPCHRVVRATGEFGDYYWGPDRKAALISWEAAMTNDTALRKKRVATQPIGE